VFSQDVLKIKVQGPHKDYLTIINVLGIFRITIQRTTKDNIVIIRDLVKKYIKNDYTVILAVLPSNINIATQKILKLAEDYNKNSKRTFNMLIKPDLVLKQSTQAAVYDLVKSKKRPFTLGYFVVRNYGASDSSKKQPKLDQIF
jgi:hypothetical protein